VPRKGIEPLLAAPDLISKCPDLGGFDPLADPFRRGRRADRRPADVRCPIEALDAIKRSDNPHMSHLSGELRWHEWQPSMLIHQQLGHSERCSRESGHEYECVSFLNSRPGQFRQDVPPFGPEVVTDPSGDCVSCRGDHSRRLSRLDADIHSAGIVGATLKEIRYPEVACALLPCPYADITGFYIDTALTRRLQFGEKGLEGGSERLSPSGCIEHDVPAALSPGNIWRRPPFINPYSSIDSGSAARVTSIAPGGPFGYTIERSYIPSCELSSCCSTETESACATTSRAHSSSGLRPFTGRSMAPG
jgi:hypothetical protein